MLRKIIHFYLFCGVVLISCGKDSTTADCTGITPTYTADIAPLFNSACATSGCHSSLFPAAGVDLSTYEKTKSASLNGKVLQSIKHQSGVEAMPQGASKFSDDKILKVECWINNGAPQ